MSQRNPPISSVILPHHEESESSCSDKELRFFIRMDINILQHAGLIDTNEVISLLKMVNSPDRENLTVALAIVEQKINNYKP